MKEFDMEQLDMYKNPGIYSAEVFMLDESMYVKYEDKTPDNTYWESQLQSILMIMGTLDTSNVLVDTEDPDTIIDAISLSILDRLGSIIRFHYHSGCYDGENTIELFNNYLSGLKERNIEKHPYYLRLVDKFKEDDIDDDFFDLITPNT
ncbi:MAG: hypothetical protein IJJ35_05320 [Exiguobacterium sp.]|uniref:hypothetical protein n=1 Tax=Exiguobacterium sp. TaxID=44751 RepID=UPI00257DB8AB|nr:hypothetical protein [Exiguobacterium sp.]MBQ6459003.1 hypothetical protein [Exiguobacterium sp.]